MIVEIILEWSQPMRARLLNDLSQLPADGNGQSARVHTLEQASGLLKTEGPVPSDEQIEEWLEERRLRNT